MPAKQKHGKHLPMFSKPKELPKRDMQFLKYKLRLEDEFLYIETFCSQPN